MKNIQEQNSLCGRYAQRFRNADINIVKTNRWLKITELKAETDGLIIAAIVPRLLTRNRPALWKTDQT